MTIPLLKMDEKIKQIREFMAEFTIDAWLIYDFRGVDPTGEALLGHLAPHSRQYAIIIAHEDPILIIKPRIESQELIDLAPNIQVVDTRTQTDFAQEIYNHAKQFHRIAANFSENPQTDVLPSGRLALLEAALPKVEWVPGENLLQIIHAVLSKSQLKSHVRAAQMCTQIMQEAFAFIADRTGKLTEQDVANLIMGMFEQEKLTTADSPMVAVQANTANPHYTAGTTKIRKNNLIMIDLWAKWEIFADITWMAFTGSRIPTDIQNAWDAVAQARKAATSLIKPNIPAKNPDERAREILIAAGFEDAILHRTGHSIDTISHGKGANLDSFEMPETRLLLPNSIVSVEPAVYLKGRFGVRSEIDVMVTQTGHQITTPPQNEILCL